MAHLPLNSNVAIYLPQDLVADGIPTVLLPGWGATVAMPWSDFASALANRRQAPVYVILHDADAVSTEGDDYLNLPLPRKNQRKKLVLVLRAIEDCDLTEFHLVGYSEGAMRAALLAERFRSMSGRVVSDLVLINPPVTGKESLTKICVRALRNAWHRTLAGWTADAAGQARLRQHKAGMQHYGRAFGFTEGVLFDAVVPGQVDLGPLLLRLSAAGLPIRLLPGQDDAMVTCSRVRSMYDQCSGIQIQVLPGTHWQIFLDPQGVAAQV